MASPSAPRDFRGRFLTDLTARSAYSEGAGPYRIVPGAVAIPSDREDLCSLIRHAAEHGVPITPRGAGSGIPGGNVGSGVIVDLGAFDRPARVALAQTANVGAAVTWATVNQIASHFGFRLPPDPASGSFCTIGGMVSTNAAGARSLGFGSMRPWVRGVEFVTADGEASWLAREHAARKDRQATPASRRQLIERLQVEDRFTEVKTALQSAGAMIGERFPATRKNTAGYALDQYLETGDLIDLVIGSEGTLGIVTRVELQLDRLPQATGTLLLALSDLNTVSEVVGLLLEHAPTAIELLDRTFLDLAASHPGLDLQDAGGLLIVEFERGSQADLRDVMATAERGVAASCLWRRSGIADRDRERLWSVRRGASPALAALPPHRRSLQIVEDGCVPLPVLNQYLDGVRGAAEDAGIQVVAFGHAGDGHIHINALVDTTVAGFEARLERLLDEVGALVVELGGTPSGEHGDGRLRAKMLHSVYGAEIVELFNQVKKAFDPKGILNPGIIIPETAKSPLEDLKVGSGAAEIPIAVSEALHRIERAAAWGTPPLALLEARE